MSKEEARVMEDRQINFYEWNRPEGSQSHQKTYAGRGVFLGFGVDFEELNNEVGQYTTALVEMNDGTIKSVPVDMVQFVSTDEDNYDNRKQGE